MRRASSEQAKKIRHGDGEKTAPIQSYLFGNLDICVFIATPRMMNVDLTSDQEAFIRQAIETGRFRTAEEAVKDALRLWEERERQRAQFLATLDEAQTSLARGEGRIIIQKSMRELADDVQQRGRARLAGEQPASH